MNGVDTVFSFYDVNDIEVTHPLIHKYFAEGVFGVDVVKHGESIDTRYFSESRRVPFLPSNALETFEYTNVYQVLPIRAACFPFSFSRYFNFSKLRTFPGNMWVQILARKRDDRWRDMVAAQYDAHLNGVKNPSSFSLLRRAQEWIAEKIHETAGWAEGGVVIPESEQKETEDGFQVSIRIAIQGERRRNRGISSLLESLFKPLANVNEFKIESSSRSLLSNMKARTFATDDRKSFILCTSELRAFFPILNVSEEIAEYEEETYADEYIATELTAEEVTPEESITSPVHRSEMISTPEPRDTETEQTKRKLEKAMRKIGLLNEQRLEVAGIMKGPTLQQVLIKLPRGTTLNALMKQQKNLQAELGVEEVTVTQGKQPGTAALLFRRDVRETVWLEPILESDEFKRYAKKHDLAFVAGADIAGQPIFESLVRLKHIISAGTTGGGKTEFLIALLYCLLSVHGPDELHIYGIDPKRIALSLFRPFPHVRNILTDMEEAVDLLGSITEEMDRRYALMEELGVESIQEYQEETGEKIPYIVIVIDEYADLSMVNVQVEYYIIRLGQLARQAGIHVVLATQRPAADILTSKIKTNLLSRFCFLCASPGDYATVFGKQIHPALMGQGDGLCVREGIPGMTRFQAPLLASSSKEKREKLETLRSKWVQEEAEDEEKLERLAAFIAETGETRIREIQKYVGVRTAKAQEMMQKLVAKGVLLPPDDENPRYRLVKEEK
jgi:S-DNA-T family DNA segregation ATPase FtsK/SpoIIIE